MGKDGGAVTQAGVLIEQIVVGFADLTLPERHDLHQAASTGVGDSSGFEGALYLDDGQDQLRCQACARRFAAHLAQQVDARGAVGHVALQTLLHAQYPVQGIDGVLEGLGLGQGLAQAVTQPRRQPMLGDRGGGLHRGACQSGRRGAQRQQDSGQPRAQAAKWGVACSAFYGRR